MAVIGGAQAARSKDYETIYVLRSDVDADAAERVQTRVAEVIDREKGLLVKVEAWGRRKLAYPVRKQNKGVYVYVRYIGKGGLVAEVERNLRLQDAVIKFQTVLLSDSVDVGSITVDPEEIKFERLELPPDEDHFESRERLLGLLEPPPESSRSRMMEEPAADDEPGSDAAADASEATKALN